MDLGSLESARGAHSNASHHSTLGCVRQYAWSALLSASPCSLLSELLLHNVWQVCIVSIARTRYFVLVIDTRQVDGYLFDQLSVRRRIVALSCECIIMLSK